MPLKPNAFALNAMWFAWSALWIALCGWFHSYAYVFFIVVGITVAGRLQKDGVATFLWMLMTACGILGVFPMFNPFFPERDQMVLWAGTITSIDRERGDIYLLMQGREGKTAFVVSEKSPDAEKLSRLHPPVGAQVWTDDHPYNFKYRSAHGIWHMVVEGQTLIDYESRVDGYKTYNNVSLFGGGVGMLLFGVGFVLKRRQIPNC